MNKLWIVPFIGVALYVACRYAQQAEIDRAELEELRAEKKEREAESAERARRQAIYEKYVDDKIDKETREWDLQREIEFAAMTDEQRITHFLQQARVDADMAEFDATVAAEMAELEALYAAE